MTLKLLTYRQDLEAQNLSTTVVPPPDQRTTHVPTRAGRGGAGNYVDPENLPTEREQEEMAEKTAAAISKSLKNQSRGGIGGGRGGAGNYKWDDEEEKKKVIEGQSQGKGEEIELKIKNAVDKGLKMPDKVHHGQHKNEDDA